MKPLKTLVDLILRYSNAYALPVFRKIRSSFYLSYGLLFLIWVLFFDGNDVLSMISNNYKLHKIQREIAYYENKIATINADKDELNSNKELLEKFAREKYLMKRPSEEIFLVDEPTPK